eukprot:972033-Rhodomonas_salina.2
MKRGGVGLVDGFGESIGFGRGVSLHRLLHALHLRLQLPDVQPRTLQRLLRCCNLPILHFSIRADALRGNMQETGRLLGRER